MTQKYSNISYFFFSILSSWSLIRKRKSYFFLLVIITVISPLLSRIADKRDLRGLYDAVIEEKKYLSPFHGFIWVESGLLEKYYVWGNATVELDANGVVEKIIKADNTMLCILNFFYRLPGQFGPTTTKTNPATYFTPEVIGKIVAAIDRTETLIEENPEKARGPMLEQEIQDILMGVFEPKMEAIRKELILLDQIPYIKKLQQNKKTKQFFNFTPKNWKNSMQKLSALPDKNIRQLFEERQDTEKELYRDKIISLVGDFKTAIEEEKSKKQSKALRLAVPKVSKMIVESLKECGFIPTNYEPIYPSYTTHMILLALLYEKVKTKDDFILYFKQFDPSILQEKSEKFFEGKLDHTLNVSKKVEEKVAEGEDKENLLLFIITNFEQIAYEAIHNLQSLLPPKLPWLNVIIKNTTFSSCAEATLMSFFRIIMAKIGAYNFENALFDADAIPQKIREFFHVQHVPFDQDLMQKNIAPLQAFFKKYTSAFIASNPNMAQALTDIFTNIPGIKYLQKINNNGSEEAKKNGANPVLHPLPDKIYTEDFGTHELVDDNYTLFELAPYPSSYIAMVNHFFGTHITSFEELCTVFDCTGSGNLDTGNDKKIWEEFYRNNIHKTWFITIKTIINKIPITFTLSFSTRHNGIEFLNTNTSFDRHEPMLDHLLPFIISDISIRNLTTCYPYAKEKFGSRLNLSKTVLDSAYLLFVALSSNISKSEIQSQFLSISIKRNEFEPNKFLNITSEKMLASFIVSPNLYLIGEMISAFAKKEHILSEHSLTLMEKLLSCFPPDSKKKQTLKGLVYPDVLKFIVNHHWEQFATDSHFVSILDTVTTWLNSQPIDVQQAIIIESLTSSELQTIPDSLIPCLKLALEGELFPRTNKVNYLQVLHHTKTDFFTEEDKEQRIQSVFSNEVQRNLWRTATDIMRSNNTSFLFPLLYKQIQAKSIKGRMNFEGAGTFLSKLIDKNIIPETPLYFMAEYVAKRLFNVHYITTNFIDSSISEFLHEILIPSIKTIITEQKALFFPYIETLFLTSVEKYFSSDIANTRTNALAKKENPLTFQNCYADIIDIMLSFYNKAESLDAQITPLINSCLTSFFKFCIMEPNKKMLLKMQRIIATQITNSQLYESLNPISSLFDAQIKIHTKRVEELEAKNPTISKDPDLYFDLESLRTKKELLEKKKEPILKAVKKALES